MCWTFAKSFSFLFKWVLQIQCVEIKQQNLLANGAFQNQLERCSVEALERPVKPGDEQEVMNSSDDTCSFPFLLCNVLKNWAWNWRHFCKYKVPSVISLPSAVHMWLFVCGWKDKLNKVRCLFKMYTGGKAFRAIFNKEMEIEKGLFGKLYFCLVWTNVKKLKYHWLLHHSQKAMEL